MNIYNRSKSRDGFTIVELMVATAVFGSVLLVCTYGLLEIGRSYYKGITLARNQEATRKIIEDISSAIKYSYGDVSSNSTSYCIGQRLYKFGSSFPMNMVSGNNNQLIAYDVSSCTSPFPPFSGINETLMLSDRMRLQKLTISSAPANPKEYTVTVRIATGEDADLENSGDADSNCKNERHHSAFCATTEFSVKVLREV